MSQTITTVDINPELDPLVYNILPNFRNSCIPAENSLKNAIADVSREDARRYQESFASKRVSQNTSVHPILDRLLGLTIQNFRSSTQPEEQTRKNALAQLGTEKAGKVIAVNKAFQRGNFDAAEYHLGRPLTDEEKTKKEIDFIRESKIDKIKSETRRAERASSLAAKALALANIIHPSPVNASSALHSVPQAPPMGAQAPKARQRVLLHNYPKSSNTHSSSASHAASSSASTASTALAPTVLANAPHSSSASHAPTILQQAQAQAASSGPYAMQVPPGMLSQSALDEISRIRAAGGNYAQQRQAINLVLGSEQKDPIPGTPSTSQLLGRLKTMGYTGKGIRADRRENIDFGKYTIDKKKLTNNILSFAHKGSARSAASGNSRANHSITNLPSIKISNAFKGVILETLNEMPVNLNVLNDKEIEQFHFIIKASKKKFHNKISNNDGEQLNRLSIIIGELSAGNTSKELKTELSQTLNSLHKAGLISAKQVSDATKQYIKVFPGTGRALH